MASTDRIDSASLDPRLPGRSAVEDGFLDGVGCPEDPGRSLHSPGWSGPTGTEDLRLRRVSLSASQPSLVSPPASRSSSVRSESIDASDHGLRESDARQDQDDARKLVRIDLADVVPPAQQERELDRGCRDASSDDDLSVLSMRSAATPPAEDEIQDPETRYAARLRSLAASMRRTEATRVHVVRLRRTLDPRQRRALRLAKERLDRELMERLQSRWMHEQDRERARRQQQQLWTSMFLLNRGSLSLGLGRSLRRACARAMH